MKKSLPSCPVETTLSVMDSKWKILIIRDLLDGPKRNGELLRSLDGISQKVLTEKLRDMIDDGLVERHDFNENPPHVEYALTDLGESLRPVIQSMRTWGSNYQKLVASENNAVDEVEEDEDRGQMAANQ